MTHEEILKEIRERMIRYAQIDKTEMCFASEESMARWVYDLIVVERKRCAKIADDCRLYRIGKGVHSLLPGVADEIAARIREGHK